jgi:glucose-6-phosphate-specific signal transduction histidine kinase
MSMLWFIFGAVLGGLIEMVIQHPFEDLVEKRFQQVLHTGIYRKLYFKTIDYQTLEKALKKAVSEYNFDYAKILLKQMEWFVEEKSQEEKKAAIEIAENDYKQDLKNIAKVKRTKSSQEYIENENQWKKK